MENIQSVVLAYRQCLNSGIDRTVLSRGVATHVGCRINILAGGLDAQTRMHFKFGITKLASYINENIVGFIGEEFIEQVVKVVDYRIAIASGALNYEGDKTLVELLDADKATLGDEPTEAQETALGQLFSAVTALMGTNTSIVAVATNLGNYKPEA